ncbi:uncharacterized protein LOC143291548 [Babylonia areolata]|uniref:uncharacterized protein LOC143291548 n=1 Tax=Babylonia areolata TaxID=304850 RepID=UPI003FD6B196
MEIRGVNSTRNDLFPFSALRLLGGLQIFLGVCCVTLGAVDVTMMTLYYDAQASQYAVTPEEKARFELLVTLTVTSAPVWCGTWFLVTGSLGTCVSRNKAHSLKFLKIAFLVLSVLCSAIFAPTSIVLSSIIAITRHTIDPGNLIWLVSTLSAFLSVCEMGIAITSASILCCCSPLQLAKVHILFADPADNPGPPPPPPHTKTSGTHSLQHPRRTFPRKKTAGKKPRLKEARVQTDPVSPPPPPAASLPVVSSLPPKVSSLPPVQPQRLVDPRYPILRRPVMVDTDDEDEDYEEYEDSVYCGSEGYDRLRKWALPNDRLY